MNKLFDKENAVTVITSDRVMYKLFDKENVVTVITSDRVKVGDKGYFGNCIYELEEAVKGKKLASIEEIREGRADCYCFLNSTDQHVYELFLPEDKVNLDALNFRPLKNIKELFAFMMPAYNATNNYTTDEMISMLLGRRYVIKDKTDGTVRYHVVNFLSVSAHGTVILDYFDLKFLFENYEFKRGDTFVPFGVKE